MELSAEITVLKAQEGSFKNKEGETISYVTIEYYDDNDEFMRATYRGKQAIFDLIPLRYQKCEAIMELRKEWGKSTYKNYILELSLLND